MLENIAWNEARDLLLDQTHCVGTETVPLPECTGRVLSFVLEAQEDVPSFDRSAYDGYALRAADTVHASPEHPAVLRITETIAAGAMPALPVAEGTAAHIMTGACLPEGADCVINFERTVFTDRTVSVFQPMKPGANIIEKGEDAAAGSLLAEAGTVIDAGLAGTIAAQGITMVQVYRRPVIGLICTGSELVEADQEAPPGRIRNSSRSALTSLLVREGCCVRYLGLAGDDIDSIKKRIIEGRKHCNAIVLTGGVSVGDWDLTPEAMKKTGTELLVQGVRMKPGMACAYGILDGMPVFALSGNPASALTNFYVCVLPALRRLCGKKNPLPIEIKAELTADFRKKSPSDRFLRGKLDLSEGTVRFIPSTGQGNVMLASTIGCDALLRIPAGSGPVPAGTVLSGFMLQ